MLLVLVWVVCLAAALVLYSRQAYSRFRRYNVKHIKPLPIFGNMASVFLRREHFSDLIDKIYRQFPDERFVGRYEFINPKIMVRDLELIKKITIKDFEHFTDHRNFAAQSEADAYFSRNLIGLKGQEWKDMRSTLSPAFTGSKMRNMVPFMVEVGEQMITSLKNKIQKCKDGYIDAEAKDLCSRYANDVIATCAFGLKIDSHMDEHNQFYKMAKKAASFSFQQVIKLFIYLAFPFLPKVLGSGIFPESTKNFFKNIVLNTMRDREIHKIKRPDMIHLLMEAKKGSLSHEEEISNDDDTGFATVEEFDPQEKVNKKVLTDVDMVAQGVVFFVAGFETVSSVMSFLLHELALNPEIQDKLVEEIREHWRNSVGKLDYTALQQLTYLDMVVSEVLRLYPPGFDLDRLCTKDYNLGRPNDNITDDYIVRKGEGISIPIWAIHRDPKYFPKPLKFDPERFSEKKKDKITPFTYMPFGLGPRNCIGSRFALCEVKIMAYQLLLAMEVMPAKKTTTPIQLSKSSFNLRIKGGHWVRMKVRK